MAFNNAFQPGAFQAGAFQFATTFANAVVSVIELVGMPPVGLIENPGSAVASASPAQAIVAVREV